MSKMKKIVAASAATAVLGGGAAFAFADDAHADNRAHQGKATNVARLVDRVAEGWDSVDTFQVDGTLTARAYGLRLGGNVDATVDQRVAESPQMHLEGSMLGRFEDVTVVDDTYYVKQGENYKAYTENQMKAKWAILPTNLDAVALLQKVEPSIEAARYLGTDNVNGVSATHYRFVVDSKALETVAGRNLDYVSNGGKNFTVDVWLDGQNRQVRNALQYKFRGLNVQYEGDITNVNQPVTINEPSPDQVVR